MKRMTAIILSSFLLTQCMHTRNPTARPNADEYPRTVSYALSEAEAMNTSIGFHLRIPMSVNSQKTGFRVLASGSESLEARMALVQAAEKTLDLQYYAMNNDVTSNLLIEAIIRAAERGVRVRFLIDDISTGSIENSLSALNAFPNIEVRIFNPATTSDQSWISSITGILSRLSQINKRMHNKVLVADNLIAITGGRNLGDEYFDYSDEMSFKDIDILAAGPIAADLSRSFDKFWNDQNAFPIEFVYSGQPDHEYLQSFRESLKQSWQRQEQDQNTLIATKKDYLKNVQDRLIWAHAEVIFDHPDKIRQETGETLSPPAQRIADMAAQANEEFIIVSSYLVPKDEGVEWISSLINKGVSVKIMTNSLASTDVVAAHTGYSSYREELLAQGAELYEMKPVERKTRQRLIGTGAPSHASLHSKFYIVDGKKVFVGSFNFDPRSAWLNTEVALLIDSPEIAEQMRKLFERMIQPDNSYNVQLDDNDSILWTSENKRQKIQFHSEPDSSFWRRIQAFLISLLPIEDHL